MTNLEFAQGLRELAAVCEKHPEMLVPDRLYIYPQFSFDSDRVRNTVKAFADGGVVTKRERDSSDTYYTVVRTFGSLPVELNVERQSICRKVRKMQMVETWECPDSILDPAIQSLESQQEPDPGAQGGQ